MLEDAGYTVNVKEEFAEWGIAYAALTKATSDPPSQTDYVAQDYWNRTRANSRSSRRCRARAVRRDRRALPTMPGELDRRAQEANADKFGGKIVGIEPGAGLMRETGDAVDG